LSARRVIVLGGGLAGITAALDCAEAGARVTLLEVRPRLGGAAYSFKRDGLWLDNGQHVFLRCCTAYRALLARLGSERRVTIQPRLEIPVLSPNAPAARLRRGWLPAPLHLAGALARYPHLTPTQRWHAARAALTLGRLDSRAAFALERASTPGEAPEQHADGYGADGDDVDRYDVDGHEAEGYDADGAEDDRPGRGTLGEWLLAHGQDRATIAALWDLIALPTLNLPAARGSLGLGAFVLRKGLLEHNDAGDIGFHMRPLSETLGEPAERALEDAGVQLRLGVSVERVELHRHSFEVYASGVGRLDADAVICTIPHARAATLLEPLLGADARRWGGLGKSPIVNVHIVYDRRVCDESFAAGVGTPVQYVFDRSEAAGLSDGQYLAVSLSGAYAEMRRSSAEVGERYVRHMRELFPRARHAEVRDVYVSREHSATFSAAPGAQELRPGARTSVRGLVLAGAWTDTGWPATLEGAVLSGHAAAREGLCK
jgi:monoamine oxidase